MKNFLLINFLMVFLCIPSGSAISSGQTIEHQLAILEKDASVKENDLIVKEFRKVLNKLESIYVEDKEDIAHMTFSAQKMLK